MEQVLNCVLYYRRLLAIILTGVFAFTSGIVSDSNSIISMAAEAASVKELSNLFPAGTTLRSDTFPGLYVTYNSQTTYVVKEGKNDISLGVTLLDPVLAKKSAPALMIVFGKVEIPSSQHRLSECDFRCRRSGNVSGWLQPGRCRNRSCRHQ